MQANRVRQVGTGKLAWARSRHKQTERPVQHPYSPFPFPLPPVPFPSPFLAHPLSLSFPAPTPPHLCVCCCLAVRTVERLPIICCRYTCSKEREEAKSAHGLKAQVIHHTLEFAFTPPPQPGYQPPVSAIAPPRYARVHQLHTIPALNPHRMPPTPSPPPYLPPSPLRLQRESKRGAQVQCHTQCLPSPQSQVRLNTFSTPQSRLPRPSPAPIPLSIAACTKPAGLRSTVTPGVPLPTPLALLSLCSPGAS